MAPAAIYEDKVVVDGRTYSPNAPPSEQEDALLVTRRLGKNGDPASIIITEEELRHFSIIYPRAYQMGGKSRARIEAWREAHLDEVRHWDLDGFFNSKAKDARLGIVPRKQGCPEKALAAAKIDRRGGDGGGDGGDEEADEDEQPVVRRSGRVAHQAKKSASSAHQGAQQSKKGDNKNVMDKLAAALDGLKKVTTRMGHLSRDLDDDDPFKAELASLGEQVEKHRSTATQAKRDLSKQLDGLSHRLEEALAALAARPAPGASKKRGLQAGDEGSEDEEEKRRRIKAKRAQSVAALNAMRDSSPGEGPAAATAEATRSVAKDASAPPSASAPPRNPPLGDDSASSSSASIPATQHRQHRNHKNNKQNKKIIFFANGKQVTKPGQQQDQNDGDNDEAASEAETAQRSKSKSKSKAPRRQEDGEQKEAEEAAAGSQTLTPPAVNNDDGDGDKSDKSGDSIWDDLYD